MIRVINTIQSTAGAFTLRFRLIIKDQVDDHKIKLHYRVKVRMLGRFAVLKKNYKFGLERVLILCFIRPKQMKLLTM